MDASSSPRPVRRRAHVCRVCNSAFACKAELLEHEQEAHTPGSTSSSPTASSRQKLAAERPVGTPVSDGVSLVKLRTFVKKTNANGSQQHPVSANLNMFVDHEEVYESGSKVEPMETMLQETATVSEQQMSVSSGSVVQQTGSVSAGNRQASSSGIAARSRDQVVAENATRFIAGASEIPHSSVPLPLSSQAAMQYREPLTTAAAGALGKVKASSDNTDAEDDDTKPPVSDSSTDIFASAVDSRQLMNLNYQVVGSVEQPSCGSSNNSDVRGNRNVGMLSTLYPAMTKEEAAECVAGLLQGNSYTDTVNNDELQLLAAVSSTRSRDIVVTEPDKPSTAQEQQVTDGDIVMADHTDIVEQEVELETTLSDSEPQRLQTKKHASIPKSPVCLVKLPMTPHQFTSTDGAKKRMVAITVARAPRMVSVLLRNRKNSGTEEQQEAVVKADAEKSPDRETKNETNTGIVTSLNTVTDPEPDDNLLAKAQEAATAVEAITSCNEADDMTQTDAAVTVAKEELKPKIEACMYCEQTFSSEKLAEHISWSHVCQYCGRKFRQSINLRKHVKINHENVKPHCCPICGKAFPYASYLAEHMPVHDVAGEERRYACEHCDKSFMRPSGLRKHTKEEHLEGPKPFVCPHCDRRYVYRCALEGHMRRHSSLRPFSCQSCGAGFKHVSNLQKHVKTQHPEPCSICSESTTACEHTETVRAMQKLRHRCATCARSFESAAALHVHERVHTGEKPEICEICGRSFQHKSNLQKHMMKHSGHRPHACPSCPRAFYARHSLMAHMRKHTGDSPYHCETCGKSFCTKNSLQVHINLHKNVRPFACDTCGRTFAQLGNLQKHMSVHTGDRPHKCPECSRCFSDISAMRRHRAAIHERNARYGCETCGKRFLHLSSARSHRMQHDGTKPHRCDLCSKTFSHRSGWLRHRRVHRHAGNGMVKAVVGEGDNSKEVVLKPGEYIVYLTE